VFIAQTQNIGFSDSGYIMIKPPQPSSAFYGALSFATGHHFFLSFFQAPLRCYL